MKVSLRTGICCTSWHSYIKCVYIFRRILLLHHEKEQRYITSNKLNLRQIHTGGSKYVPEFSVLIYGCLLERGQRFPWDSCNSRLWYIWIIMQNYLNLVPCVVKPGCAINIETWQRFEEDLKRLNESCRTHQPLQHF